jgi:hypothetical protein
MDSNIENEQFILVSENLSFKSVLELVSDSIQKSHPQNSLKPWMVFIGWMYQSIANLVWGAGKQLSRNDYKSLFQHSYYSNEKAKKMLGISFTPISEVIKETGEIYRKEYS